MKTKIIAGVLSIGCFLNVPLCAAIPSLAEMQPELVELFRTADYQRELVRALLDNVEVKQSECSVEQVTETIKKLEKYRELFIGLKNKRGTLTEQENRCLALTQELIRQLTNARLAYEQKIKSNASVKKIALSAGAAGVVFGGLVLLKTINAIDISVTTIVACSVAAGCVTGAVTYYLKN